MASCRMSLSCSWIQEQQFVLKHVVALLVFFCCAVTGSNFDKIFMIGDSYADIGNRDPNNHTRTAIGRVDQSWLPPYGRTNPRYPAGRFSDGESLGDVLASALGLKPIAYRLLAPTTPPPAPPPAPAPAPAPALGAGSVGDGIVFAVGGAGVLPNLGFTKTGDQITELQQVVSGAIGGVYTVATLEASLIFYEVSGNDYAAFVRNNANLSELELSFAILAFSVEVVVPQITQDLLRLYNLGFRSFVVGKLPPLGCLPTSTYDNSILPGITAPPYTQCTASANLLATTHNTNLALSLKTQLTSQHADANIIYLDHQLAFTTVIFDGTYPARLEPCCTGLQNGMLCGDVDSNNNPQYTVCDPEDESNYFFWDEFHPTEAGWNTVFNLYLNYPLSIYTDGPSSNLQTLKEFLGV